MMPLAVTGISLLNSLFTYTSLISPDELMILSISDCDGVKILSEPTLTLAFSPISTPCGLSK